MLSWLKANLRVVEYTCVGIAILMAFYTGWHSRAVWESAQREKNVQEALKYQIDTVEKDNAIRNHNGSLPTGSIFNQLLLEYGRD